MYQAENISHGKARSLSLFAVAHEREHTFEFRTRKQGETYNGYKTETLFQPALKIRISELALHKYVAGLLCGVTKSLKKLKGVPIQKCYLITFT